MADPPEELRRMDRRKPRGPEGHLGTSGDIRGSLGNVVKVARGHLAGHLEFATQPSTNSTVPSRAQGKVANFTRAVFALLGHAVESTSSDS